MTIPSTMFIQSAIESLKTQNKPDRQLQLRELYGIGALARQDVEKLSGGDEFGIGYLLGLETARVLQEMGTKL